MSKIVGILLCFLMVLGFTACGQPTTTEDTSGTTSSGTEPSQEDRITITFSLWGDPAEQETTQKALDVYNNSQDKVYVKALQIGRDEYNEKLQTMATAGQMPDCGMVAEDTVIS
ncbi:MAG: hypothetical protein AAGU77_14295, partial [Bacillota bacterium]